MNEWEWNLLEDKPALDQIEIAGVKVRVGDRVRLMPHIGGDILDIALRGQIGTVESLELDYEGKHHVCVVLDNDPGRDLGMLRQPGHRFFFDATEIEPLAHKDHTAPQPLRHPKILIAGIGNIFLGDDGFGVEVTRRLTQTDLPDTVRVIDFGIRGLDLVYALEDGYETTILVDAFPRGQTPGTVYVVEPDLNDPNATIGPENFVEPHDMNPTNVLRMAKAMSVPMKRLLLVGCEPATFGGEEGHMGLSEPVQNALDEAVQIIQELVRKTLEVKPE